MSGSGHKEDDRKVEIFDGSDASQYRRWRRRAELHLLALPTTFNKERWGPKLLEWVSGEVEELLEDISAEKLREEDGYTLVFKALDDKYRDLKQDEMHRALREYFYNPSQSKVLENQGHISPYLIFGIIGVYMGSDLDF